MKTPSLFLVSALFPAVFFGAPGLDPLHGLVKRTTPGLAEKVTFRLDPRAKAVTLKAEEGGPLVVTGPDVNRLAAGYGAYLRGTEHFSWSWNYDRIGAATAPKAVDQTVEVPWKWRQAYNYCTLSYTMAFWGVDQWEKELDRLALSGINMPLVQAGLEKVWQLTLREAGYPEEKIAAFIPNPSAAAWWNMGNLEGLSGPLTPEEVDREAALGRFIVSRARELGMSPILQGFTGLVPRDLEAYVNPAAGYADARYVPQGAWAGGFPRPAVLDPTSETFRRLAAIWYKNIQAVYGEIPAGSPFGGDLFHEGGSSKGLNVSDCAQAVAAAMQRAVPNALWVLQAWGGNPSQALLKNLKAENTLILALSRDMSRGKYTPRSFGPIPWLWCELLNFGGNQGLYGNLRLPAEFGRIQNSPAAATMQGLGLLSEGFETNPVFYELFLRRITLPKDEIITGKAFEAWLCDALLCRYGAAPAELLQAWILLDDSAYKPLREQEGTTESIYCARPSADVRKVSSWSSGEVYYDTAKVRRALDLYMKALKATPALLDAATFRFDLADLARQALADADRPLLAAAVDALRKGDETAYSQASDSFLRAITLMDDLLAADPLHTLRRQLDLADAKAGNDPARRLCWERAARRLYTTWSGKIDNLNDYAHRQYSGLLKGYYGPRWKIFFESIRPALASPARLNELQEKARRAIETFETAWENPENALPASENQTVDLPRMVLFIQMYLDSIDAMIAPYRARTDSMPWSLTGDTLTFTVTDRILTAGDYTARFQWKSGAHALKIHAVELYEGDKLVASDLHEGWTGIENRQNTYTLKLPALRTNLAEYTIRAKVSGANGSDSSGTLDFFRACFE